MFRRMLFGLGIFCGCVFLPAAAGAATLTVNSTVDNVTADTQLTLREALMLASGTLGRAVTVAEKAQVDGANWIQVPVGSGKWYPDTVSPDMGAEFPDSILVNLPDGSIIYPTAALPNLGQYDNLDGTTSDGHVLTINGKNAGAADGLVIDAGGEIATNDVINLAICYFNGHGLRAEAEQNGYFHNLLLYGNGKCGLVLGANYATAVYACRGNTLGGYDDNSAIYNNSEYGIAIYGLPSDPDVTDMGNTVSGMVIGTDSALGTTAMPNGKSGIYLKNAFGNTLNGNTIVGGRADGIMLDGLGAFHNLIISNQVGINMVGEKLLGNLGSGINLASGAHDNQVGEIGEGNIIEGNNIGILVGGGNNLVVANGIGTDEAGVTNFGNLHEGIKILGGPNDIGGTSTTTGNIIAANGGAGVAVASGTGNRIRFNSIYGNGGLGIDLAAAGVTVNDANDADTGANNLQNFPVLTGLAPGAATLSIQGTLTSTPNASYTVDFYASDAADPVGHGEGETWIGSVKAYLGSSGMAAFSGTVPLAWGRKLITATATDAAGNTSEFSALRRSGVRGWMGYQ